MADKRINALTTATSSTSDDFFAIDGTTNGTKKLSAFSPSFGGNATVTGTLTANGAITGPTLAPGLNTAAHYFTAYGATTSWPLRISTIYDSNYVDQYLTLNGTLTGSRATPTFTGAAVGGSFIRSNGENSVLSVGTFVSGAGAAINTVAVFNPTNVTIPQTTASTTTSSGALVVSGGVGVAGAIYAGGLLSSSAATSLDGLPTAGLFGGTKRVALGYNTSGDYGFVACADSGTTWKELHLNPLGGLVKVPQSTVSNDAYTGAFVVGGGVGAAGAVNAGTFFGLVDGVTAPATGSGYARIYVDSADGDLKVKFGDGTVKTIATDS